MPPSDWHNNITQYIIDYGNSIRSPDRIIRVGSHNNPINIPDTLNKNVSIQYRPDSYYISRSNKNVIFEVVDSQKNDGVHADVIKSFISFPINIDTCLIFVVKTEKRKKEVKNEANVIFRKLIESFNEEPLKKFSIRVVKITESKCYSPGHTYNKIKEEIRLAHI